MKRKLLLVCAVLMLFIGTARAGILTVRQDGSGDFTTLTEAVAASAAGDEIILCEGAYDGERETYPITVDHALTIRGEGEAVLDSPRFTTLVKVLADDVTIENVRFDVRKWGIVADQSRRMTLRGCTFRLADEECRTSSTAVWSRGMKDCTYDSCSFNGVGMCVAGDPLSATSPGKAVLTGLCEVGEDPEYFTSHTIENCTVNGKPYYYIIHQENVTVPEDAGGMLVAYCSGVTVAGADVSDSSMGLEIVHSSDVTLRDITADRCGIFGTYLAFVEGGRLERVSVTGTNHAIDNRASTGLYFTDCHTQDSDQGIFIAKCTDCVAENCLVERCGFGFFVCTGEGNTLRGCTMVDNEDSLYLQNERKTTIQSCTITGSNVAGLRVLKSSCVCEDTLFENCWTGVLMFGSSDTAIRRCTIRDGRCVSVYMGKMTDSTLEDCVLSGTTPMHYEIDYEFDNMTVVRCAMTGAEEDMIRLKGKQLPEFIDCTWNDAEPGA